MKQLSFIGGLRTGWFNATVPFAGLTLSDEGMTVRLFGVVWVRRRYSELAKVERIVGGMLGSPGVRIYDASGDRFVFWSFNPEAVLEAFRQRGVEVNDSGRRHPKVWFT